jgi:hypothetical protein
MLWDFPFCFIEILQVAATAIASQENRRTRLRGSSNLEASPGTIVSLRI